MFEQSSIPFLFFCCFFLCERKFQVLQHSYEWQKFILIAVVLFLFFLSSAFFANLNLNRCKNKPITSFEILATSLAKLWRFWRDGFVFNFDSNYKVVIHFIPISSKVDLNALRNRLEHQQNSKQEQKKMRNDIIGKSQWKNNVRFRQRRIFFTVSVCVRWHLT